METPRPQQAAARSATLSRALKDLRRRKGLRSADVAKAIGMSLRSYQRFESGRMGLELGCVWRFAETVDADAWAILFAVELEDPTFALSCADNKAASAFMLALRRFNARAGKDIARLDTRSVLMVFGKAFDDVSERARAYEAYLEAWMLDGAFSEEPPRKR